MATLNDDAQLIEMQPKGEPAAGTTTNAADADSEVDAAAADPGMSCGSILVLVLLSPFLLVLFILLALVWLFLLPFRSCMHSHSGAARSRPADSTLLTAEEAGAQASSRGDFFQSKINGVWLFHRRWMPVAASAAARPRGLVFVAHGFGEHISRAGYSLLAKQLTDAGFAVFALDHQGHGRSTGDRAWFESMRHVVADYIHFVVDRAAEFDADIPRFLFGHSMGGLIALSAACDMVNPTRSAEFAACPLSGVVLSAPCLAIDPKLATPPLKLAAKVLSSILPKMALDSLPPSFLSRNDDAVKAYLADPLVYSGGARTRVAAEMLREMDAVYAQLHTFKLPLLLVHGTEDAIVPLVASSNIYRGVASSDKKFIRYAGCKHEIFEEEEGPRYLADIQQWMSAHAPGSNAAAAAAAASSSSSSSSPSAVAPVQAESTAVVPIAADAPKEEIVTVIAITAE